MKKIIKIVYLTNLKLKSKNFFPKDLDWIL